MARNPKKTADNSFLQSIANELLAKYRRLDAMLTHAPTKGTYHEEILRQVIRDYLPSTFSTGEGFISTEAAKMSTQMDILVVDNMDPRSFVHRDGNFFIAASLAVCCMGEVKTYPTKRQFTDAFHKMVSTSMLFPDAGRLTSFIFCYDARATLNSFVSWVDEALISFPEKDQARSYNYPDYVFCLKLKVKLERKATAGGFTYVRAKSKNPRSNLVQILIIQDLFQCVTDGCGRIRLAQNFNAIRP